MFHFIFRLLAGILLCFTPRAFGAACCGGSLGVPFLILGDEKAQISGSYAHSRITDDVNPEQIWQAHESRDLRETYKIDGAHIFLERWQAGFSLPIIRRSRASESSSGLGDILGQVGYEVLPNWDYNPWRPRGILFFQLTIPTGRSIHESEEQYQLDARGRGFYSVGLGAALTKDWGRWDLNASLGVHRALHRKFENSQTKGELHPGYGGDFGFNGGWNSNSVRFGCGVTWNYEDPVEVTGPISSAGAVERFATVTASGSYLFPENRSVTFSYSNQKLVGDPVNTGLGESVSLSLRTTWAR